MDTMSSFSHSSICCFSQFPPSSLFVSSRVVVCMPFDVKSPWGISCHISYKSTLTRVAFLESKVWILQLLSPLQSKLVPILGKRSGLEEGFSKKLACADLDILWRSFSKMPHRFFILVNWHWKGIIKCKHNCWDNKLGVVKQDKRKLHNFHLLLKHLFKVYLIDLII
jgi:hypothetical protein